MKEITINPILYYAWVQGGQLKFWRKRKYAKWHLYNLYALNVVQSDFDNNINTPTEHEVNFCHIQCQENLDILEIASDLCISYYIIELCIQSIAWDWKIINVEICILKKCGLLTFFISKWLGKFSYKFKMFYDDEVQKYIQMYHALILNHNWQVTKMYKKV